MSYLYYIKNESDNRMIFSIWNSNGIRSVLKMRVFIIVSFFLAIIFRNIL